MKTVSQLLAEVEDYLVSQAAEDDTKAFELAKQLRVVKNDYYLRILEVPRKWSLAHAITK